MAFQYMCYPPSRVDHQQGSSCPVLFESIERGWVRFWSKGKLYLWSKNGEVGARCCKYALLLTGRGRGCCLGVCPREGGGALAERAQLRCSGSRSQCWEQCVCARPAAAILNCSVVRGASARSLLSWGVGSVVSYKELSSEGPAECKASARHTLWANGTRLSTKEKQKKKGQTLLPRFYCHFRELSMGFAGDTWFRHLRYEFE